MASEVVMPRLSDTMDSGTVGKWLKQVGDPVKKGDILAEIETDKSNMELESYANGILAVILVQEGEDAVLGAPIAMIAADEAEAKSLKEAGAPAPAPVDKKPEKEAPAEATPTGNGEAKGDAKPSPGEAQSNGEVEPTGEANGRVRASPLARRLAQENSIDLSSIPGTGPGGRIVKEDVEAFLREGGAPAQPRPAASGQQVSPGGVADRQASPMKMTRMQQTIARRMTEARFSAPDFVLTTDIDMTEARALLQTLKQVEGSPRVGPNDLLIRAVAISLRQHPEINSGWENDTITAYGRVNVGVAVAIPGGLVVPVLLDADRKSLGTISAESKSLIEKARTGKLLPNEYEGGTCTVSNLGMFGIEQFTPVIDVPQAAILGVGSIVARPVVLDGAVVVRERMKVTMACDHRVANGAQGAEFLQTLRRNLEHPLLALL